MRFRPAAEDHDLAPSGGSASHSSSYVGVQVGRGGRELRRAGVDSLVHRPHAEVVALVAHRLLGHLDEPGEPGIGESLALQSAQSRTRQPRKTFRAHARLLADQILDLRQEPRVDARQLRNALERPPGSKRIGHVQQPIRAGGPQLVRQPALGLLGGGGERLWCQTIESGLQPAQRLVERLLERAPDGHDLADRLHLRRQPVVGRGKLLEREAGNLGDHIVDGRLERGRRRAPVMSFFSSSNV